MTFHYRLLHITPAFVTFSCNFVKNQAEKVAVRWAYSNSNVSQVSFKRLLPLKLHKYQFQLSCYYQPILNYYHSKDYYFNYQKLFFGSHNYLVYSLCQSSMLETYQRPCFNNLQKYLLYFINQFHHDLCQLYNPYQLIVELIYQLYYH